MRHPLSRAAVFLPCPWNWSRFIFLFPNRTATFSSKWSRAPATYWSQTHGHARDGCIHFLLLHHLLLYFNLVHASANGCVCSLFIHAGTAVGVTGIIWTCHDHSIPNFLFCSWTESKGIYYLFVFNINFSGLNYKSIHLHSQISDKHLHPHRASVPGINGNIG